MKHTPSRAAVAAVACLGLLFGGVTAVTPAGASFTDAATAAAQLNWNRVWNQQLKPKTDRRYYTKAKSNRRYYTKRQTDSTFYSRTESDSRFETRHQAYRGTYFISGNGAGSLVSDSISYGATLAVAPTAHYIRLGDPVPAGCSGSASAPNADPGHLCVFEANAVNVGPRYVTDTTFAPNTATPTGAYLYATVAAAGNGYYAGTWVLRPGGSATVTNSRQAPSLGRVGAEIGR
ncbi:hypothetical protein [Nocardioides houyundeii]|uniref:hypothetical protein n=1 Tax=Nocardioides houyundeii TaxID=2045452 RepID=UPI00131521DB|nr:hypothetical protein [Nocardioides houyundeii]